MDSIDSRYSDLEVIVVGSGLAALGAALILGDSKRRVLLLAEPLSLCGCELPLGADRPGCPETDREAARLLEITKERVAACGTVEVSPFRAIEAQRCAGGFVVTMSEGSVAFARLLLLAPKPRGQLPAKFGFREFFGAGVHLDVNFDGKKHRNQPLVVVGKDHAAALLSVRLLAWSAHVIICSDGDPAWPAGDWTLLRANGIRVFEKRVDRLGGDHVRGVDRICFADDTVWPCSGVFIGGKPGEVFTICRDLGGQLDELDLVRCHDFAVAGVPGLYLASSLRTGSPAVPSLVTVGFLAGVDMANELEKVLPDPVTASPLDGGL